jgi:predicted nucleic acid-binding Zn ribbon protein
LKLALGAALPAAAPAGVLAQVQAAWADVAGAAIAAESEPISEREGVVTIGCRAAVWAQELELLGEDLRARLNARLAARGTPAPVAGLRFVVRSS